MDRRDFLKKSLAGAGVVAVSSTLPAVDMAAARKAGTNLPVEEWVKEPARRLAVVDNADVVVVGGGPAGFAAAVAAARHGADVVLLERQYFLGGLFTGCGVTPIINMFSPRENRTREQAIFGICQELCDRLDSAKMMNLEGVIPKADPEAAKYFMEEMAQECGVRMLYGVNVSQVIMSGDRIDAVIVEGKSGRVAIRTKFVVDCSGDGDVLEWVGEDFNVYKDDIGAMWRVGNAFQKNCGNPTPVKGVFTRHTVGEREQDGLDMYNLTRVQLLLRKRMWDDAVELRKNTGNDDLFLLDSPSVVGVRVTRVLNSLANVKASDAAEGRQYDDVIGLAGTDSVLSVDGVKYYPESRPFWQVPYRALVPKTVHNLLVAGRCFGFERPLTYDAREVGTCFMTGQAAGVAASLCVAGRLSNKDLDVKKLQSLLKKDNVRLA